MKASFRTKLDELIATSNAANFVNARPASNCHSHAFAQQCCVRVTLSKFIKRCAVGDLLAQIRVALEQFVDP